MSDVTVRPPSPSEDLLREQAQLVARCVRPLALVGSCRLAEAPAVRHRLLRLVTRGPSPSWYPTTTAPNMVSRPVPGL
jgi:hypothetical protein